MDICAALPLHQICAEKKEKRKKRRKNKRKKAEHRLSARVNVRVLIMLFDYESKESLVPVY